MYSCQPNELYLSEGWSPHSVRAIICQLCFHCGINYSYFFSEVLRVYSDHKGHPRDVLLSTNLFHWHPCVYLPPNILQEVIDANQRYCSTLCFKHSSNCLIRWPKKLRVFHLPQNFPTRRGSQITPLWALFSFRVSLPVAQILWKMPVVQNSARFEWRNTSNARLSRDIIIKSRNWNE